MKMSRISTLLFGSALLFSSVALAGETNKGKLRLADKIVVDGKPLEPGNYAVEWDGSGPAVGHNMEIPRVQIPMPDGVFH